ncbi:MAG TPA: GNAT family N-acetyltransferase [Microlunatus sp.]|nr:GNAT family N-acetyltransferase [Microlunatus sp.]
MSEETGPVSVLRRPTSEDVQPIAAWHPIPTSEVLGWWELVDVEPWAMDVDGALAAYGELWFDAEEDEVELARLIVAPALRGRGLGKRLVRALMDKASATDLATTMLRVEPDNEIAIRCYPSCGFEPLGPEESATWNEGQRREWFWMRLPSSPSGSTGATL